jgi:hypothetical protein
MQLRSKIHLLITILTIISGPSRSQAQQAAASSQPNELSEIELRRIKNSAETIAKWNLKKSEIQREIAGLRDHAWSGSYYHGDGLGSNAHLTLAPQNGFVFITTGCLGVYDRNYGSVKIQHDGLIRFVPAINSASMTYMAIIPVQWGKRHYLISEEEMPRFCGSVNCQLEPRKELHGSYYLREGDESESVTGLPRIPERFSKYLLAKPLTAVISKVVMLTDQASDGTVRPAQVELVSENSNAIFVGMQFYPEDYSRFGSRMFVTVEEVKGLRIRAKIKQFQGVPITPSEIVGVKLLSCMLSWSLEDAGLGFRSLTTQKSAGG